MTPEIRRRSFLTGLSAGASALALPFLRTHRARAALAGPPTRFVFLYTPNGQPRDKNSWDPTGGETDFAFTTGSVLEPLSALRPKLIGFTGVNLNTMALEVSGLNSGHNGSGHLLTANKMLGTEVNNLRGGAISVDQYIAKQLSADPATRTPMPSLELAVNQHGDYCTKVHCRVVFAGADQPLPALGARTAYDRIVQGIMQPTVDPNAVKREARRRGVLDLVQRELGALKTQIAAEDAKRLDQHLTSIRELEQRLATSVDAGASCISPHARPSTEQSFSDNNRTPDVFRAQLDNTVLALSCNLTRIVTLQFGSEGGSDTTTYPWLNIGEAHHALTHKEGANYWQKLIDIGRWWSKEVAYFLGRLNSIPQGDGTTLLDHTVFLWGTPQGNALYHANRNVPFLMAGSGGGYFRTGRWLKYDGASHSNMLVSICRAMGLSTTKFGHPDYCTGPLPGLSVNG